MRRMPYGLVCGLAAAAVLTVFEPAPAPAGDLETNVQTHPFADGAPFGETALPDRDLGDTRGTAGLAIMGDVAVNLAGQSAAIGENAINAPTTTGSITGNTLRPEGGVFMSNVNSGNFNSFQNIFQLNIQMRQ